ncbi:single-stranded DNA-binding protein [Ornithinimicrobium sp. Arc0846-15]|nr:single-stranded DNA-binding protein [Ornithinimicrobium laminariae]
MNDSFITVTGNVTGEPQARAGRETGTPFTVFGVAQNRVKRDAKGDIVPVGTNFYEVIAFRALGQNVLDSIAKGDPVVVRGRLRVHDWENGERKGTTVQIDATNVGPDLTFGTSEFSKRRRSASVGRDRIDTEVNGGDGGESGDDHGTHGTHDAAAEHLQSSEQGLVAQPAGAA